MCGAVAKQAKKALPVIPNWLLSGTATQQNQPEKIGCFAHVA
jgi:hypothetical protein